jgi:hypothetical protein
MNAREAITRSRTANQIVHVDYDADVYETLLAECVDNTDSNTEHEFWGDGWRVHMALES